MKTLILYFSFIATALFMFTGPSVAQNYKYTQLQIKDYDEMKDLVDQKIRESKTAAIEKQTAGLDEEGDREAVEKLRQALQMIFSRPDKDNMVAKLVPNVRRELSNYNAFEDTLASVSNEAIAAIENEKLPVEYRSTAVFIVENILADLRPLLAENDDYREIVKKIKEAQIKIPDKVKSNRKLTSMDSTPDLSKVAARLLKEAEQQKKKEQ